MSQATTHEVSSSFGYSHLALAQLLIPTTCRTVLPPHLGWPSRLCGHTVGRTRELLGLQMPRSVKHRKIYVHAMRT